MHKPELVDTDLLKLNERSPRKPSAAFEADLDRSVERFGLAGAAVARHSDGLVIGGNQLVRSARRQGIAAVPVIWVEGNDREMETLGLALNHIQADWDETRLAEALGRLADVSSLSEALRGFDTEFTDLAGFSTQEVLDALATLEQAVGAAEEPAGDLGGDPQREPASGFPQLGYLYRLGQHRLVVGDATEESMLDVLAGDASIDCLITDPPYGVDYHADAEGTASSGRPAGRRRPLGRLAGDGLSEEEHRVLILAAVSNSARHLVAGATVYLFGGSSTTSLYDEAFGEAGFKKSDILVWDKGVSSFGRRDYQSQHELVHYGWKLGAAHPWFGGRRETTIWRVDRDPTQRYRHPTQKPVELFARAMRNSTQVGARVLDCFAGSGSALIAAEQTGRTALLMEIDPRFAAVIIDRWQRLTGEEAQLIDDTAAGNA